VENRLLRRRNLLLRPWMESVGFGNEDVPPPKDGRCASALLFLGLLVLALSSLAYGASRTTCC
jgi:hypothetical protein